MQNTSAAGRKENVAEEALGTERHLPYYHLEHRERHEKECNVLYIEEHC